MSSYQVIARRFRPQIFAEIVGQAPIIITLKNAIRHKRFAQAYLFCGSRGIGKTTFARVFAKAMNCPNVTEEGEPCNHCASCKEIATGTSLDVMEFDGASNRGIDDIRQINETVGYATASGHYKIYIIDEVHMLTKEAFNALLKTLEEPPPKVKFFFATTEPHKIPSTILSRCQRFNLQRIPLTEMIKKLQYVARILNISIEESAIYLLAIQAEGSLRDAESLLDQVYAFSDGTITANIVNRILGLTPREVYFAIDQAGKKGELAKVFEISHQIFNEGKDLLYFIEGLLQHIRQILLCKLKSSDSLFENLTEDEKKHYQESASFYSEEQCVDLIEYLVEAQQQLRSSSFSKFSLEAILLHVMQSHFRLPIEYLVHRLTELESLIQEKEVTSPSLPILSHSPTVATTTPVSIHNQPIQDRSSLLVEVPLPTLPVPILEQATSQGQNTFKEAVKTSPSTPTSPQISEKTTLMRHRDDTLFYFASIELEGRLQKM
jgi:DNA polymerase-3 subunit gamma/tau